MSDVSFNYYLGAIDYVIFVAMLVISAFTGIYFACRHKMKKHENQTLKEYLTGNKNLKPFPVAMSLIASYISGVTMLGTPAEIYNFGAQYWLIVVAMTLSGITVATVYLPVFTKLEVCSSYEYLELRFNKVLRTAASFFFIFDEVMFLPMLVYVPSLALSQVSGINLHLISIVICGICVFYTILGGLRAVIYTDTWQTALMFVSDLVVIIIGVVAIGGFDVIVDRGIAGNRLQTLSFSPSMYDRYTFFSILIGGFTFWTSFNAVNQTMVQRYLSLPNERQAKISIGLFTFGVVFFISMCCFVGVLIYGTYYDCDPKSSKRISTDDQLLPLFVVEKAGHLPGVPGLFIAGLFGAALSSLSVVLNSSAIVVLEDILRGTCHVTLTEFAARIISKVIILILGIVACAMVLVVERLGGIFEVTTTLSAISGGTMFGVFSLGMLIPWSNTIGAICGAFAGFVMSCVVAFGSQYVNLVGIVVQHKLPVAVDGCLAKYNISVPDPVEPIYPDESDVFPLFRLAYFWITPVGVVTVMTVGVIISFITGKTDISTLDPDLISPISQWMLPASSKHFAGTAVKKIKHQRLLGSFSRLTSTASMCLESVTPPGNEDQR